MAKLVALLRAVNVGGRKLPMAELRSLCGELGWEKVETYIQSGNVVFSASGQPEALEAMLETAIKDRFRLDVPVIVRTARQWASYAKANPFPEAAQTEPKALQLLVSKRPPDSDSLTSPAMAEAAIKAPPTVCAIQLLVFAIRRLSATYSL
jgi:uncharacterized protein (DUF1697 family)